MSKNQLFRKTPPQDVIVRVLSFFGINDDNIDVYSFTKSNLIEINTVEKISSMITELELYYFPCKSRLYLNALNTKNVITLLRHFLKLRGYVLLSKDKYIKGEKYYVYTTKKSDTIIIPDIELKKKSVTTRKTNKKVTIQFD